VIWAIIKRIPQVFVLGVFALVMTNCTMLGLNYASLETGNKGAPYPAIAARSLTDWQAQRGALLTAFEREIYGPWPEGLAVTLIETRIVDDAYMDGRGTLEELTIQLGQGDTARTFQLGLATPNSATDTPAPLIIGQTFSSNCAVFPDVGMTAPNGEPCGQINMPGLVTGIFGEFIAKVPADQYFDRGYAYASYFAGEVVPDRDGPAQQVMTGLTTNGSTAPTGALMAWAYAWSAAIDVLEDDPRIDQDRLAVWGHSRHAKSALLAGIYDRRIDAVLSHQSGYGGAASNRSTTGEGIGRMVAGTKLTPLGPALPGYPHWFAPEFAAYAGRVEDIPVDQHQLLALLAPTPVLLSNGRRDVWSDPNSTYIMAAAADQIYELYGTDGLNQSGMQAFNPSAHMSYFIRPGGHGTHQSDIDAFLAFADAALDDTSTMVADCPVAAEGIEADASGEAC